MTDYYVKNAGDDAKDGLSDANAWKTISKVQSTLTGDQSDDIVYFNKGDTWREKYTVAGYGTSGHPFTHTSYGTGADPIIKGCDVEASWTNESSSANNGDTSAPGSAGSYASDYIYYHKVTVTGGDLTSFKIYYQALPGSGNTKFALYTDSSGPANLVTNSESEERAHTSLSTGTWETFNVSGTPTVSGGTYWMAFWCSVSSASNRAKVAGGSSNWTFESKAYNSWPSSASAGALQAFDDIDLYCVTSVSSNYYYATGYTSDPHVVIKDGTILKRVLSKGACDAVDEHWYDSVNDRVYIYFDPSGNTMEIGTRDYGIDVNGKDYITIDGLYFTGGTTGGIRIENNSTNCTIQNSEFKNNWVGISAGTGTTNTTISTNTMSYHHGAGMAMGASGATGFQVDNNTVSYIGYGAHDQASGDVASGIGGNFIGIVENNEIHHVGAGQVGNGYDHGIYITSTASNGAILRYNKIYNCNNGYGIITKGTSTEIYYNLVYENSLGIGCDGSTGYKVNNNVVYNNSHASLWGDGLRVQSGTTCAEAKNNIFLENNVGGSDYAFQICLIHATTSVLTASDNNIIYGSGSGNVCYKGGTKYDFSGWQGLGYDVSLYK